MVISPVDFIRFALALIRLATFLVVVPVLNMRNAPPILIKVGLAALCAWQLCLNWTAFMIRKI